MRFDVITLFPELFTPHLTQGITRRAFESKAVDVRLWPLRDFANNPYRRVDDRPYGGGPGMVLMAEPLTRALNAIAQARQEASPKVIHFTPTGQPLTQSLVHLLAQDEGGVLLCGRYEGIDQRFIDRHIHFEISLGDFVLSGGELPALALLDAIARLQPQVLGDEQSHQQDSFSNGLLDCPHYTRPEQLEDGTSIPDVLLSGNHQKIAHWRRQQSLQIVCSDLI
jgi:tRNA (guanine37-N1)-methyltransferase